MRFGKSASSVLAATILTVLFLLISPEQGAGHSKLKKRAQPASVTGTYKNVLNSLEVLELPDHTVRINFSGFWPNSRRRVETRNVGTFDETVPLNGRTAIVKLQYGDDPCVITLKFDPRRVEVSQEGSILGCGFGFNVEPDGTYLRVSSKPPLLAPRQ
jgi:hypothetical protein